MIASRGSLGVFWSSSLVGSITMLALLLFWPVLSDVVKRPRKPPGGLPREAASS